MMKEFVGYKETSISFGPILMLDHISRVQLYQYCVDGFSCFCYNLQIYKSWLSVANLTLLPVMKWMNVLAILGGDQGTSAVGQNLWGGGGWGGALS